jgi:kumamolisin
MRLQKCLLTAACAVGILGTAVAAPPQHTSADTQDAGPTASSTEITTSIILNVTDPQGLQRFVYDTTTPGSFNYHRFLNVEQFVQRFAPSNRAIAKFVRYLESYGITVNKVYADNLDITVTGTAAQLNAVFATQLHDYTRNGQRFHRPAWKFVLPGEFSSMVLAVPGLSNEPSAISPRFAHIGNGAFATETPGAVSWPQSGTATGIAGDYTVGDVANRYDVNPLYRAGITGRGQTIGIMTLADFNADDAYAYWSDIGLKVRPNRITKVLVDGGTPIAAGVGDNETSLDVEQSGGLAPDAKIRVYIAPNGTNNGFMDLFYAAASDNQADTVSISWGEAEEYYFAALEGGVDYTGQLVAIDQALMEGAAQGQSFFAAAGDSGAYDANEQLPYPYFSMQLSVDAPADDPFITAAGGTTLPLVLKSVTHPSCPAITVSQEQVWGYDYINNPWLTCHDYTPYTLFPEGGGGGVSSFWSVPFYQRNVDGIQLTQPGQDLIYYPDGDPTNTSDAQEINLLPANFAGRNVPDLSLNADPESGYIVVDCTDFPAASNPGCAQGFWGGTSFVAPQLNGLTALIDQAAGGRVGLLNPAIYALQKQWWWAYGRGGPFDDITAGDNWFYQGVPGYDDGSGIGTLDVAHLAYAYMFLAERDYR